MTVARWLRWAFVFQFILVLAWLAWTARAGAWALLAAVLALPVLLRLPLAAQFVLARQHAGREAGRAGRVAWLRAWWAEGRWATRVFGGWQPFGLHAIADNLNPARAGRGMVLVHGLACNRAFWTPWLRRLSAEGRAFIAVNLEPPLGSIDNYPPAIDDAVRTLLRRTGLPPLVVAHSMGGLAVRAWMAATPDADALVAGVVTIATPHQGTAAARFAFSANGRQMRVGSAWLRALAEREPLARRQRFTCWRSDCDNLVYPPGAATLPDAAVRTAVGQGHVQLAFEPTVMQACWRQLAS